MANIYTYPNATDSAGMLELYNYSNTVAGGILFPIVLLALWFIAFINMLRITTKSGAWTFASLITTISSIILAILNLIAPKYMYISMLALAFGTAWMLLEGRGD